MQSHRYLMVSTVLVRKPCYELGSIDCQKWKLKMMRDLLAPQNSEETPTSLTQFEDCPIVAIVDWLAWQDKTQNFSVVHL